tara:strand:- start:292 stop:513 length:222 start_codon:yes stop_codon:yes gene_type:complete
MEVQVEEMEPVVQIVEELVIPHPYPHLKVNQEEQKILMEMVVEVLVAVLLLQELLEEIEIKMVLMVVRVQRVQ